MKKGDKIIWCSGFGYDLGYYVADKGVTLGTCLIDLCTGTHVTGEVSVSPSEVIKYGESYYKELVTKYGYNKRFTNEEIN